MDKREMIERVLAEYVITGSLTEQVKWDALADQAIVIECEVEHVPASNGNIFFTNIESKDRPIDGFLLGGKHGIPGKAIAIILSLEKENDGETC